MLYCIQREYLKVTRKTERLLRAARNAYTLSCVGYQKGPSKEVTITNPILDGCNNNAFKYERTLASLSP